MKISFIIEKGKIRSRSDHFTILSLSNLVMVWSADINNLVRNNSEKVKCLKLSVSVLLRDIAIDEGKINKIDLEHSLMTGQFSCTVPICLNDYKKIKYFTKWELEKRHRSWYE